MVIKNDFKRYIIWIGCLVLLSACGGGSGGGGDGGGSGSGGSTDAPFNSGTGFGGGSAVTNLDAISLATDGSGDVYAGGKISDYNGTTIASLARIKRNGALNVNFNPGSGFSGTITAITPATDGSGAVYVAGGFTGYNGTSRANIARLNSDGSLDSAFDPGTGTNARVRAIVATTDGSGDIYIAGSFTSYNGTSINRIARINSNGSLDTGFDSGSGFDDIVYAIALANDGSGDLYAGGRFTTYRANARSRIARINSDGSNDAGFDPGSGFDINNVLAIAVSTDGSGDIYAGGIFSKYRGVSSKGIVRINSDGTLDAGFNTGSGFQADGVTAIALARDGSGSIYTVGNFSIYRGNARSGIARIKSDGSNDASFNPGSGADGSAIWDIALATDGSGDIFLVGPFTTYNSVPAIRIIRVDVTGAPN